MANAHRCLVKHSMSSSRLVSALAQAPAYQDGPSRGFSSSGGYGPSSGGGNSYGQERNYSSSGGGFGSGGGYGMGPGSQADPWTEAVNAVSTTVEQNLKVAATYASSLSSWASTLIANLDPAALLFEDDDEYDGPIRCAPALASCSLSRVHHTRTRRCKCRLRRSPLLCRGMLATMSMEWSAYACEVSRTDIIRSL